MTHTAKHTPGPSCTCQVRHHRHDTGIGVMEETDINICPFHAAAPAMYEALKEALDTIAHMRHYYAGNKLSVEDIQKIVDDGRAALAQAEGGGHE